MSNRTAISSLFKRVRRTTSPALNTLFLVLATIWIVKAVWLDAMPGIFPGAQGLGNIVDELFSAIVAGYIFFIVFSLAPSVTERAAIEPYLRKQGTSIIREITYILNELARAAGDEIDFDVVTIEKLSEVMTKVPFNSHPNMLLPSTMQHATWFQHWYNAVRRAQNAANRLLQQGSFLPAEVLASVARIDESHFFNAVPQLIQIPHNNENLGPWADLLMPLIEEGRHLKDLIDRHLPEH